MTSSSTSRRDASIAFFDDASNSDTLAAHITTALQTAGHSDAITSGATLESQAETSYEEDDDDKSFPIIIVAAVAGVVGILVLVGAFIMCSRSKRREMTITSSENSSGTKATAIGQGFQSEPLHMFEGPGADDL
jgi:hypothetical protein